MSLFVKVCGITNAALAAAAVEAGVDAVGFVFHPESPRVVTPERAATIAATLPPAIEKVAVFLRPSAAEIEKVLRVFPADTVQADHGTIARLESVTALPVYRQGEDVGADCPRFLLEGMRSGVGVPIDWDRAAVTAQRGGMILAGGLTAGNVAHAIRAVSPFGVDVSSGVETEPGVKDRHLVREFVARVRAAEKEIARV